MSSIITIPSILHGVPYKPILVFAKKLHKVYTGIDSIDIFAAKVKAQNYKPVALHRSKKHMKRENKNAPLLDHCLHTSTDPRAAFGLHAVHWLALGHLRRWRAAGCGTG